MPEKLTSIIGEVAKPARVLTHLRIWPLKKMYFLTRRLIRALQTNIWIISGRDGIKLKIVYAGCEQNKNYIANLAFGNSSRQFGLGSIWLWNLFGLRRRKSLHEWLFVYEIARYWSPFFSLGRSFFIPCWIGGTADLSKEAFLTKNESQKTDLRVIRKYGLSSAITTDEKSIMAFYRDMYLPYISDRFANKALPAEQIEILKESQNCELIFLKKEKELIAGRLIRYRSRNRPPTSGWQAQ